MAIKSADTGDQNLVDQNGNVTPFHMQTVVTLDTGQNTLTTQIHSESHAYFVGFHGASRAFLNDANGKNIYMSPIYPCGVDARIFAPHGRDCQQLENIPPAIVQATQTVAAVEFYDPQNVILQFLNGLVQGLDWQNIANQLAAYAGTLIISALAS